MYPPEGPALKSIFPITKKLMNNGTLIWLIKNLVDWAFTYSLFFFFSHPPNFKQWNRQLIQDEEVVCAFI